MIINSCSLHTQLLKIGFRMQLSQMLKTFILINLSKSCFQYQSESDTGTKLFKFDIYKQIIAKTIPHIRSFGYNARSHKVYTRDGYILTMQRILPTVQKSVPVLLLPGGSCAPITFVEHKNAIGFKVADKGYDVWLGNFRGNMQYSRHVNLSIFSQKFWDFSWDDQGYYDIPTMIDFILQTTGYEKLILISYSMAGASVFALQSTNPEYNNKVVGHIALAPMMTLRYISSVLARLAHNLKFKIFTGSLAVSHAILLPTFVFVKLVWTIVCIISPLCSYFLKMLDGFNPYLQWGPSALIVGHAAGGQSGKAIQHLFQMIDSDPQHFDYGKISNIQVYGTDTPPAFNLSLVTAPTIIFAGANDAVANPLDTEILSRLIKPAQREVISDPRFNHLDYILNPPPPYFNETLQKILQHVDNFATMISKQ